MIDTEVKDMILFLRLHGFTISGIYAVTGVAITKICEVIYEDRKNSRSNKPNNALDGVF